MHSNVNVKGSMDEHSGFLVSLSEVHHKIHEGLLYQVSRVVDNVADDGATVYLIVVPAGKLCHLRLEATSGGDAEFQFYEGPTTSNNGTAVGSVNRNRKSTNTAETLFYHTPTFSDAGVALMDELQPGGTGGQTPGASRTGFEEWVLKDDTKYLLRLYNRAGQAQPLGVCLNFYEVDV